VRNQLVGLLFVHLDSSFNLQGVLCSLLLYIAVRSHAFKNMSLSLVVVVMVRNSYTLYLISTTSSDWWHYAFGRRCSSQYD